MIITAGSRLFLKDKYFWLCVAAAPVVWIALSLIFGLPSSQRSAKTPQMLAMTIVIYPLLEEIVFRGALQGWLLEFKSLAKKILYLSSANWITSLVFAGMHFINHAPVWAALVLVPSLVFGWSRDRYKSVVPSICLHSFYNAGFILLLT